MSGEDVMECAVAEGWSYGNCVCGDVGWLAPDEYSHCCMNRDRMLELVRKEINAVPGWALSAGRNVFEECVKLGWVTKKPEVTGSMSGMVNPSKIFADIIYEEFSLALNEEGIIEKTIDILEFAQCYDGHGGDPYCIKCHKYECLDDCGISNLLKEIRRFSCAR